MKPRTKKFEREDGGWTTITLSEGSRDGESYCVVTLEGSPPNEKGDFGAKETDYKSFTNLADAEEEFSRLTQN